MIINNFKNILGNYVKAHGKLTQREFCRKTGIKRTSASELWNGQTKGLSYKTLNRLVTFFHVPVSKLLEYKPNLFKFYLFNIDGQTPYNLVTHGIHADYRPAIVLKCKPLGQSVMFTPIYKRYVNFHHRGRSRIEYVNICYQSMTRPNQAVGNGSPNLTKMGKLVSKFSNKLKQYLLARCIIHSGLISKSDKYVKYIFQIKPSGAYRNMASFDSLRINWNDISIEATPKALIQLQHRKPHHQNMFKFTSYVDNEPSLIYDYTTNNFKK